MFTFTKAQLTKAIKSLPAPLSTHADTLIALIPDAGVKIAAASNNQNGLRKCIVKLVGQARDDGHKVPALTGTGDPMWETAYAKAGKPNGEVKAEPKADAPKPTPKDPHNRRTTKGKSTPKDVEPKVQTATVLDVRVILEQAKAMGASVTVKPDGSMAITFA